MRPVKRVALVYGAPAGVGGLGVQVASAIQGLAIEGVELHAFGPGRAERWPLPGAAPRISWHDAPPGISRLKAHYTPLRWRQGRLVFENSRAIGSWAAEQIARIEPDCCYVFTQVGLESLKWAERASIPTVLESPNGHIRNFRRVYDEESARWCAAPFHGHPNVAMVERVEQEYLLAGRIRVSSEWSRRSMLSHGVTGKEIGVFEQPVDLSRYTPNTFAPRDEGRLRVCYVGSLDLRKGFVYLLRAAKMLGAAGIDLEIVGATGDSSSRKLFQRESVGLTLRCAPGDPIAAYQRAELFVLPTLEDGSPFAVAEAMSSGLPVIVTDCCGAADWVRPGESGWVVPGRDAEALATAIEDATRRRKDLRAMGQRARNDTERRAGLHCLAPLREWIFGEGVHIA
jgi:glycosyltransferase involved in cell wall biosynthesis